MTQTIEPTYVTPAAPRRPVGCGRQERLHCDPSRGRSQPCLAIMQSLLACYSRSPRAETERHRPFRLHADDSGRNDWPQIGKAKLEGLDEDGQHQHGLGEPELGPDTNSGPSAERHVRVACNLPIAEKTRRIEGVRVRPTSPVTVQDPGRNDDQGAPRDFDGAAAI